MSSIKSNPFTGLILRALPSLTQFWAQLRPLVLQMRVLPLVIVQLINSPLLVPTRGHLLFVEQTRVNIVRTKAMNKREHWTGCNQFKILSVILDSDGSTCHSVMALIDTDTTATRSWTIHVSQYTCQNRYSGGPSGCLQYFYDSGLSNAGTISNFGFDRSLTSIASTGNW